jgi:hypothetical protein
VTMGCSLGETGHVTGETVSCNNIRSFHEAECATCCVMETIKYHW